MNNIFGNLYSLPLDISTSNIYEKVKTTTMFRLELRKNAAEMPEVVAVTFWEENVFKSIRSRSFIMPVSRRAWDESWLKVIF